MKIRQPFDGPRHSCGFLASLLLLLLCANSCNRAKSKLIAGSANGVLSAPNTLATTLRLINNGEEDAEDVRASSISIAGARHIQPATVPVVLGAIPKDRLAVLSASFNGASFEPSGTYTINVEGTFREHGRQFEFALAQPVRIQPDAPDSARARSSSSPAQTVSGTHYSPQPFNFSINENEGRRGWIAPNGPNRPAGPPSSQVTVRSAFTGAPPKVDFKTNTSLGLSDGNPTVDEPSGAVSSDGTIFETTSIYGYISTDGEHFSSKIDPSTIFPNADGGLAFDKIVQYVPGIDRFIWIMQFSNGADGHNRYRIAAASPSSLKNSSGTSWTYWDITSTQVGGDSFDYPDLVVGDNSLYLSGDLSASYWGRIVIRMPLSDIKAGGNLHFLHTLPRHGQIAWGGHLTQNPMDEVFWAGTKDSSTIRVFNWLESSTSYSWTDVGIATWPSAANFPNGFNSLTPDNVNWLSFLSDFPGNAIIGATRRVSGTNRQENQVLFAWSAGSGLQFPQPQVQLVALDRNNNFKLIFQQQIWATDHAYAYPALAVNSNNDIGLSLEAGGGGNYENHVVGFWGDSELYPTTSSAVGTTRFGDFVTIRPYTRDQKWFAAFGYGILNNDVVDTHFVVFGRPPK